MKNLHLCSLNPGAKPHYDPRQRRRPPVASKRAGRRLLRPTVFLLLTAPLGMSNGPAATASEGITASSVHSGEYLAAYALDGDLQTRWASRASDRPEWLQVDFGRRLAVDQMVIHWERAHAVEYEVRFSDDGQQWRTVGRNTDGRGEREVLTGLAAQGRYCRIVGLKHGPYGLYSIWEVEFPEPQVQAAFAETRRAAEARKQQQMQQALADLTAQGVEDLVFAVRPVVPEHWYANFGYYAADQGKSYFGNANKLYREGGRLCRLHLATGKVTVLLDDPQGGVRDPQVHYDGRKILFSYRQGGTDNYLLYEINTDGTGLRQLTDGIYDDLEPSYLPDGNIVFVSSRCKRWVNCWLTQVAVLYQCDADGRNVRALSSNNEHDNTPWPLPDGRILYTRWEYVDRSQVDYHHLWVVNPDGTSQMVFYGNLHPGVVMIGAKPIPGSHKIVAAFSPGHGQTEHEGAVTVVDPLAGPDERDASRRISRGQNYRDPWAFSESTFLAAHQHSIVLMNGDGDTLELFRLSPGDIKTGLHCHEPRPLVPRPREVVIAPRIHPAQPTGRLLLANVYDGRNMAGVQPGEIKKLLVLESLPKPINFTGGMDPLSYGGTFSLERVLGTVPVEADGSAYLEVPALRSVFFVALDEHDLSVKRMQSFVTVQPGEVTSCVGCHEQRTRTPASEVALNATLAARRAPSRIEPMADCPDVFDFPRDIQPVLDALCADCHGYTKTARGGPYAGRVILSGERGPMFSHGYFTMTVRRLFSDGRNEPRSNYAPRTLGSSASRILKMLDGSHYAVQATAHQKKLLRLWIESGAPYPGTYAALGSGMIGGYAQNQLVHTDFDWPTTTAGADVIQRRCAACHDGNRTLPKALSDEIGLSFWRFAMDDPRLQFSRHILFNLSQPEQSLLLLAPLAVAAGGFNICNASNSAPAVFADAADPDYQKLLAMVAAGKAYLEDIKRFDMPDFQPRSEWVREMRRYGVLAADTKAVPGMNVYATEQRYWESLWYSRATQ